MRENCTSGLTRGSNGNGHSRPLLSTLPASAVISRRSYLVSGISPGNVSVHLEKQSMS